MGIENILTFARDLVLNLTVEKAALTLWPLTVFLFGLVLYSSFVFVFYYHVSKRDIFKLIVNPLDPLEKIGSMLEYIFLFPIIAFFWFLVMASSLSVISSNVTTDYIFLISMAITATVRVTAYINESLSKQVSRIVPMTFLGVILVNNAVFTPQAPLKVLGQLPSFAETLAYYFLFLIGIELLMKSVGHYSIHTPDRPEDKDETVENTVQKDFVKSGIKEEELDYEALADLLTIKKKVVEKEVKEAKQEDTDDK